MQNLVNNAVKFTTEGEITIGFELAEESKVRLYVKDTGAGIDKKNFEIIFDQFRQIDGSNVRKFGGTGLGLAICKNLTELLQGKIWLESEKGIGSTFFIELPLKSGYKIEDKYVSVPKEHVISNKTTVLVVDDDHDTLMLLVTLLRNEGIQTITADSGYRALEIMEREALPDIILMDLQMPVLNGVQTLKIIRELYPNQKVIAQSAHALEGERSRTILTGFDDYISKPFSKEALLETIQKVLGG
jgi:CheY-like chemotaxis protein